MTVKELKEKLNQFPDNMDVFVAPRVTEFAYGLVNSVEVRSIQFVEDILGSTDDEIPEADCVVIDEQ